jgi:hypothetical protein
VQLQQHLNAAVSDAQQWAYIAHMAETTNAAETAKATAGTVPTIAQRTLKGPRGVQRGTHVHSQEQPRLPLSACDAQRLSLKPHRKATKRYQHERIGTDLSANAAATSAPTGTVPAMSPTRPRHNGTNATGGSSPDNAAAAALRAAAAANCEDPSVLKAVLKAAATTAKALGDCRVTAPQGRRRGGRPPPTRKERPRAQSPAP